jgi:hypothetical protein
MRAGVIDLLKMTGVDWRQVPKKSTSLSGNISFFGRIIFSVQHISELVGGFTHGTALRKVQCN